MTRTITTVICISVTWISSRHQQGEIGVATHETGAGVGGYWTIYAPPQPGRHHREHAFPVAAPRVTAAAARRRPRKRRARPRVSSVISAVLRQDCGARLAVLLDRQIALDHDGVLHRLAHGVLQILRPSVERLAMQEDRPRDVEMVGDGMEFVEFVHAVGHGVCERVFLCVDRASLDGGDRFGQIPAQRHGAEQFELCACTSLGSTRMRMASRSAGICTGCSRLEIWRKPFSNQPRMR